MKDTFADTFYFLALLNPRDQAHSWAIAASTGLHGKIITTDYVLVEVADAFSRPLDRPRFLSLLELLRSNPEIELIPASQELLREGIELYRKRPDKGWSLTDRISFVVMEHLGMTEVLTGDEHFGQAGFMLVP